MMSAMKTIIQGAKELLEAEETLLKNSETSWNAVVKQRMAAINCTEGDAIRFCVNEYPELYQQFLEGQRKK